MEFEYFKKIIQKDVNNYIAVKYDGSYKCKGAYVKKLSKLDNDLPIVNEALINYFVKDIPIEETINNCNDLIKFQKVYKLSSNYDYVLHNNMKSYNKSYRVFASRDNTDTPIFKCKGADKCDKFANTPEHAFIINDDINGVLVPDKLDKKWYIELAHTRVNQYLGII
jgi:hypothetical protein